MKHGFLRVAAACPQATLANPEANGSAHLALAKEAALAGVKVLCFPELSLSCYTCGDLFFNTTLQSAAKEALRAYTEGTKDLDLLSFVGMPLEVGGKLYNCAVAISGGHLLGIVPKTYLPNYSEFGDVRHFAPAPAKNSTVTLLGEQVPFGTRLLFTCPEMPGLTVGAEICEDAWVSASPSASHAVASATLVVNLSASSESVGKPQYRRNLICTQSARTHCAYVYANAGEGESTTDLVFSGHSFVCEDGDVLAENKPFGGATLIQAVIDVQKLQTARMNLNTFVALGEDEYLHVPFHLSMSDTAFTQPPHRFPFVPSDRQTLEEHCKLILEMQSRALANRMLRAHAKTLVLGVSGGLDSTLALLVSVRAARLAGYPTDRVISVTMPGFGTTTRTKGNAERLAELLCTTLRTVSICGAVTGHFADISHDPKVHNAVYENAQARERTQVLMDLANAENGLVVGTGDLSELALGWATYNGDHMSMYGVNAGIAKTLMRHLVAYGADSAEAEGQEEVARVLRDILSTPVSPELLPPENGEISQQTEGIVGPYELHDFFLFYTVRYGFSPAKILRLATAAFAGEYDGETVRRWLVIFVRRFFSQQFKRSCLPDGPKVGSVSLSPRGTWQMPSDADATAWLKELQ